MSTMARKTASPGVAGAALVELRGVSKRFVKSLDTAAKIGNLLGAGVKEEVVRAVDDVDLAILPGRSRRPRRRIRAAASRRWGASPSGLLPLTRGERYWRGAPLSHLERRRRRGASNSRCR